MLKNSNLPIVTVANPFMKRWLYSKSFFALLVVVGLINLFADLAEAVLGWLGFNQLAIAMDFVALTMALWIFLDLQWRRPQNGNGARRR